MLTTTLLLGLGLVALGITLLVRHRRREIEEHEIAASTLERVRGES